MLKLDDVSQIRLLNHKIINDGFKSARETVDWMGAIQAQDFAMSKLAVGLRFSKSTEDKINYSLDNAEILRTHLLRPTWHLVSADDIYWMLSLTAPRLKSLLKNRLKELELTDSVLRNCNNILEKALVGNKSLARKKIVKLFADANIKTNENRASHILMQAELNGIICSGKINNNDSTYALLEERVSRKIKFDKNESLAKLAVKYFQSHSPATANDFSWWSGLTLTETRKTLDLIKYKLICEKINGVEYFLPNDYNLPKQIGNSIFLLPAYDEFIISYKDKSASLISDNHKKTISSNGLFRPIIILNGKVIGIWKRSIVKTKVSLEIDLFENQEVTTKNEIVKRAIKLKSFYNKEIEVNFKT